MKGDNSPLFLWLKMILEQQVRELIEEKLKDSAAYLVDVKVGTANKIMVEVDHPEGMSIQGCVEISRHVEQSLDREKEDFELQVSSPGLDKGFKVFRQYQNAIGKEVEVRLKDGEKIKGTLLQANDQHIQLEWTKKEKVEGKKKKQLITHQMDFSFDQIEETKRVISFK